ncbi:MAG: tetratricopeptide repeat protein [Alphaproteobacteria bacterium]|jgi:Tfp pilus assembly protein PilF|nr:tetratricopeptide repeat protein [Alphaproteobacteria bacterium]
MRKRALTAAFLLLPSLAFAAAPSAEDKLFAELKKADSAEAAKPIETKLNELFHASGSASVDLLMTRAGAALGQSDHGTARKLMDAVTRLAPDYAEGWRLRARMQQASGDDTGAMVSLDRAVRANPRHFTAMAELAEMMEDYGDKAGALKLYRRALALDPHLAAAAERAKALTKEIEGQGI